MNSNRLLELDALRGLAAIAVVVYHYFYRYNEIYGHENLPTDWSYLGKYGVHLFFMVSGFVIFWTLNRTDRPLDFLVSRFSRLYPAYWAAVIITFLAVFSLGLPGREVSLGSAIVNILMFQEYLRVPHVDGVYWTLTIELTFYFWIFLLYISSNLDKVVGVFSVLVVASVAHSLEFISIPYPLYKVFILKYIPLFLAGICFYKLTSEGRSLATVFALGLSLSSIIAIYSLYEFFLFSFFYLLFYLAVSGNLKVLSLKPLVFLGSISYSLYLLHQNVGYIIINKTYELQLNPILGVLGSIVISIGMATLLVRFIEKPALNKIRSAYKRSERMQNFSDRLSFRSDR
ncbi:MAG: acyltransferase [Pseudomonadota bacterium]|nr:acyltransferase [Pseudomonadota bacterium]MEC8102731.1 acyltransferase [Pseudomonadota bacterium]